MKVDQVGVHMTHCNMDDYIGCCKYGEDETCPALKNRNISNKFLLLDMTRDELATNMQNMFAGMIVEANEWRPLADYVLDLVKLSVRETLNTVNIVKE